MISNRSRLIVSIWVGALIWSHSAGGSALAQSAVWKSHDLSRPKPPVVTPGQRAADAPSDAIVLFNGKDLDGWTDRSGKPSQWKVVDGNLVSVAGAGPIYTQQKFGSCQLHLEFATPENVVGNGQGRGNSGVYLMEEFEIQVLDSFKNDTYADGGVGALYGQVPPLANASRPPGQWQTYDIIFHQPQFDAESKLLSKARVTLLHNGVLIQDESEYVGPSDWLKPADYDPELREGRLALQDHGNPVKFRNIWIRNLNAGSKQPAVPADALPVIQLSREDAQAYLGTYGTGKRKLVEIKLEGDNLVAKVVGRTLRLNSHSKTEFSFARTAGNLTFTVGGDGKVSACNVKVDAFGKAGGERQAVAAAANGGN